MNIGKAGQALQNKFLLIPRFKHLDKLIFLTIGLGLALAIALLISLGEWIYAVGLAVAIPIAVLLITYPFAAIIIWLITLPFMGVFQDADNVYWILHRLLIPVSMILAIFAQVIRANKKVHVRLGLPELAMLFFLLMVGSSIFITQNKIQDSIRMAGDRIFVPFCMYLLVRFTIPREKAYNFLVTAAFFIALSQSIIGFVLMFAPQILPPQWLWFYGQARTTGSVLDANVFTTLLVFCSTLLFHSAMNRKAGLIRSALLIVCGLSVVNIIFSYERASWIGALFVIMGLLVVYPKLLRLVLIFSAIMVVFGASVFSTQIASAYERMIVQRTINDRVVIYDALIQMVEHKPLFGWGYESVDNNIVQFYRQVGNVPVLTKFITSHNTYLTIMAELGPISFLMYIFPFAWWFLKSIRFAHCLPKSGFRSRSLLIILWLAIIQNFIVSNFFDMRFFPLGLGLWWMGLGLVADLITPYIGVNNKLSRNRFKNQLQPRQTSIKPIL
jgi:O-antigen ligase